MGKKSCMLKLKATAYIMIMEQEKLKEFPLNR